MMESLTSFLSNLSLYRKIYDSSAENEGDDSTASLLFLDKIPKIKDEENKLVQNKLLPVQTFENMYSKVDFTSEKGDTNKVYYSQTMSKIKQYQKNGQDFKIYIDEYGGFRKIIITSLGKTELVKNMYFILLIILLFARPCYAQSSNETNITAADKASGIVPILLIIFELMLSVIYFCLFKYVPEDQQGMKLLRHFRKIVLKFIFFSPIIVTLINLYSIDTQLWVALLGFSIVFIISLLIRCFYINYVTFATDQNPGDGEAPEPTRESPSLQTTSATK